MGRPARFTEENLTEAAVRLAARLGPARVTMSLLASETGAPVGSLYHRYPSKGALLASAWSKAAGQFGARFLAALASAKTIDGAVEAALVTPRFARDDHAGGVVLFAHRRDDFLHEAPEASRRRAAAQTSAILAGIAGAAKRLLPGDPRGRDRLAVALLGVPYGAVRIFLPQAVPPQELDATIAAAARAALIERAA